VNTRFNGRRTMFFDSDERLLLLQQRINPLEQESLNRLAEAGIKTVLFSEWASWHEIEPSPGQYDWGVVDGRIDMARKAGLRVGVQLYCRAPDWLETGKVEFFHSAGTSFIGSSDPTYGLSWVAVDPFNAEAMKIEAEFLERACEHYTVPGAVECFYAMPYSAEIILPFGLGPYTAQMCVDVVVGRQRIFAKYSNELWTAFHPHHSDGRGSVDGSTLPHVGNEHVSAVDGAMKTEFPAHTLNRLFYCYFMVGGPWPVSPRYIKHWVGAEYAQNVAYHATLCDGLGVWGMVMGHSEAISGVRRQPTSQEYDEVAKAIAILERGGQGDESLTDEQANSNNPHTQ